MDNVSTQENTFIIMILGVNLNYLTTKNQEINIFNHLAKSNSKARYY